MIYSFLYLYRVLTRYRASENILNVTYNVIYVSPVYYFLNISCILDTVIRIVCNSRVCHGKNNKVAPRAVVSGKETVRE